MLRGVAPPQWHIFPLQLQRNNLPTVVELPRGLPPLPGTLFSCCCWFLAASLSQLLFTHRHLWRAQKGSQPCDPFSQVSIRLTEKWVATVCCIYMRQASRQAGRQQQQQALYLHLPLLQLQLLLGLTSWALPPIKWFDERAVRNFILPRCGMPRLRYTKETSPKSSKLRNLILKRFSEREREREFSRELARKVMRVSAAKRRP